jgi:hypothetical protein
VLPNSIDPKIDNLDWTRKWLQRVHLMDARHENVGRRAGLSRIQRRHVGLLTCTKHVPKKDIRYYVASTNLEQ